MVSEGKVPEEINVENVLLQAQTIMEKMRYVLVFSSPPPYVIGKCRTIMEILRMLGLCTAEQDAEIENLLCEAEDRYKERINSFIK